MVLLSCAQWSLLCLSWESLPRTFIDSFFESKELVTCFWLFLSVSRHWGPYAGYGCRQPHLLHANALLFQDCGLKRVKKSCRDLTAIFRNHYLRHVRRWAAFYVNAEWLLAVTKVRRSGSPTWCFFVCMCRLWQSMCRLGFSWSGNYDTNSHFDLLFTLQHQVCSYYQA